MAAFIQEKENTEGVLNCGNKGLNLVYPVQNKQNLKPDKLFWKGTGLPGGCQPSSPAAPREAGVLFAEWIGYLPRFM